MIKIKTAEEIKKEIKLMSLGAGLTVADILDREYTHNSEVQKKIEEGVRGFINYIIKKNMNNATSDDEAAILLNGGNLLFENLETYLTSQKEEE